MSQPSTAWTETVEPDEERRHEEFAQLLLQMQTRISAKRGPGRTFHRKPIAALSGTLTVPDGLPEYAAHQVSFHQAR